MWHIQRGIGSWPSFFEHLPLATFTDVGNTFGTLVAAQGQVHTPMDWALRHLWPGLGAEVRLDIIVAWRYGATLGVGVAQGGACSGATGD